MAEEKEITKRFNTICDYLCQNCYGQESVIKFALFCIFAKDSIEINFYGNDRTMIEQLIHNRLLNAFNKENNQENVNNYVDKVFGSGLISQEMKRLSDNDYLDYITNGCFPKLTPTEKQSSALLKLDEIDAWQKDIDAIPFSDCVQKHILRLRKEYEIFEIQRIIHLARTSAFLNGRSIVNLTDFINVIKLKLPYEIIYYSHYINERTNPFREPRRNDVISNSIRKFQQFIEANCESDCEKETLAVENQKSILQTQYTEVLNNFAECLTTVDVWREELNERNIFAEQNEELKELLEDVDKIQTNTLENEKILKEQYAKAKFSFVSHIKLGDIVCKDGSLNGSQAIATICLKEKTEDSLFGISVKQWKEREYAVAAKLASEYNGDGSSAYDSGWILPSIEQLEQIYKNLKKPELEQIKNELEGCFWSSTKNNDDLVYFFDFSTGKMDYTTPDHPYNVVLLHQFCCGKV